MKPTNPNAHTYVNGTDVKTHGYAVTAQYLSAIVYLNSFVHVSLDTSLQCGVESVECGVCSVKSGVWSVKCGVGSVECVKCRMRSVKCRVWSMECKV